MKKLYYVCYYIIQNIIIQNIYYDQMSVGFLLALNFFYMKEDVNSEVICSTRFLNLMLLCT